MVLTKKIAITGGSGHLGYSLIQALLKIGYTVNALYTSNLPSFKHINLTWIKGDITDTEIIAQLIEDCSIVIHAAGMISIGDKNPKEVYRINVLGTQTLVNTCVKKQQTKLIYISSSNAVKEGKKNIIFDETRPYKTSNDFMYPFSKAEAEKVVLQAVKNHQLNAFIIRPTSIVGPPDNKPSLLGQTILDIKNNKLPIITTGGYNLVDVRDLTQTIINSFILGEIGEIYLVGGTYISVEDIAKVANKHNKPLKISLNLLLYLMPIINGYRKFFKLKYPITKESISTLKHAPKNMDITKAKIKLKHISRPAIESIQDFIVWSEQNNR
ncbi:dihydroflavonol-4-reductase [Lutibacter agarilyticus]|uniref:Dihydroflavonol-4-reductase n=1 Tax=Lutibacter agarilyticus TaxID=1109740 RepID=A0A238VGI9_9FLAO|nr:NAD-dependent epimerase/dehydratase family protein [Lutibacter agarilyticus]SNR33515.1 dihydroflavonol-4-reductase [Lutibacter agarilyticus]